MEFIPEKKPTLERYRASDEELSNRQLKVATWLVRHRRHLQKFGTFLLILFCIASVGFSLFRWTEYGIFGFFEDRLLYNQQVIEFENYRALQPSYVALPILVNNSTVLRGGTNKYDFITEVRNVNDRWVAQVTYKYIFNGGETPVSSVIIMPGQQHLLPVLGFEKGSFPSQARLVIVSTNWRRVSPHAVADVPSYIDERIQFEIASVSYGQSRTDGGPSNSVLFNLSNPSAYGYVEASFYVVFFDRGSIVAIRPLTLRDFEAGTTELVDFRLVTVSNRISDLDIIPIINIFDTSLFIDPES